MTVEAVVVSVCGFINYLCQFIIVIATTARFVSGGAGSAFEIGVHGASPAECL